MITKKAANLANRARAARDIYKQRELSRKAFAALFEGSKPTRDEFDAFSSGLVLSGGTLWDLMFHLMYWQGDE